MSHPYPSNIHPSIPEPAALIKLPLSAQSVPAAAASGAEQAALSELTEVLTRRHAETLTERQKFSCEPSALPGMQRRLSYDGLVNEIKSQIEYWDLIASESKDEIDNIVSIRVEVTSTQREYFTISGKRYPAELVHQRYSQITCQTIEYVLECLHKCGSDNGAAVLGRLDQEMLLTEFKCEAYRYFEGKKNSRICEERFITERHLRRLRSEAIDSPQGVLNQAQAQQDSKVVRLCPVNVRDMSSFCPGVVMI